MSAVTGKSTPKQHHIDLGSGAYAAVAAAASNIASTEADAAATVSSSTDLIVEILSRLPVKTLCRFRCVSKHWHSLVSDPIFIAAHDSRAEPLLVCSFRRDKSLWLMDMDGNVVRRMKSVDACLSLYTNLSCFDDVACFTDEFPNPQVIDLATGETLLTRPKLEELVRTHPGFCAFPLYSYSVGRTALSRLYKVVGIKSDPFFCSQTQQSCSVLTLGDRAGWRQTQPPASRVTRAYQQSTVTMEGVMYFLVSHENKILCFDLENEEWMNREIEGPWVSPDLNLWAVNITQLNGSLCIAQTVYAAAQAFTDIWLLTDSEKSIWSKTYTIPTPKYEVINPLTMLRDGTKLLFCCGVSQLVRLQVYDPCLQTCTDVKMGLPKTIGVCKLRLERFVSASS